MSEETQTAFGRRVGVSQQRVGQWLARGLPRAPSGRVDVERALTWLEANRQPAGGLPVSTSAVPQSFSDTPDDDDAPTLAEAQRRKTLAQAERERIRVEQAKAELVSKADVETLVCNVVLGFRAALEGLPGRLCSELAGLNDPAQIRAVLQTEHRRVLADLAGRLEAAIGV